MNIDVLYITIKSMELFVFVCMWFWLSNPFFHCASCKSMRIAAVYKYCFIALILSIIYLFNIDKNSIHWKYNYICFTNPNESFFHGFYSFVLHFFVNFGFCHSSFHLCKYGQIMKIYTCLEWYSSGSICGWTSFLFRCIFIFICW